MKCIVIEGVSMVSVAHAWWPGVIQAEEKYCSLTTYPTVGDARTCGLVMAKMVEKAYMDWTIYRNRMGMRMGPNTWKAFL